MFLLFFKMLYIIYHIKIFYSSCALHFAISKLTHLRLFGRIFIYPRGEGKSEPDGQIKQRDIFRQKRKKIRNPLPPFANKVSRLRINRRDISRRSSRFQGRRSRNHDEDPRLLVENIVFLTVRAIECHDRLVGTFCAFLVRHPGPVFESPI